jgi:NitT/TauT family transport system ATP-binding protein
VVVLSDRPARISYELALNLPRPRDLTHPEVVEAIHRILAELGMEGNAQKASVKIQNSESSN